MGHKQDTTIKNIHGTENPLMLKSTAIKEGKKHSTASLEGKKLVLSYNDFIKAFYGGKNE